MENQITSIKPLNLVYNGKKPELIVNLEDKKNCICGNYNYHSAECKSHKSLLKSYERRTEKRKELRKELRCIYEGCAVKVKPIIVYNQYCKKHKPKWKKNIKY